MLDVASFGLSAVFIALVLVMFVVLLQLNHKYGGDNSAESVRKAAVRLSLWLALAAGLALMGLLADFSLPPKLPALAFAGLGATIWFGTSRHGARLAQSVPLWVLIGINAFRLPLEVIMNHAAQVGVMPVQMSYSGQNYDVITGLLALVVGGLEFKGLATPRMIRTFNIVGSVLLINVVMIGVLSMPLPFRVYMNEPANIWLAYFPFVWLPTFLVPVALLSHILILRRIAFDLQAARKARS